MLLTINPQLFDFSYEVPKSFGNGVTYNSIEKPKVSHLEDGENYYLVLEKKRTTTPNPFFPFYVSDDLFSGYSLELTKNHELVVHSQQDRFYTVEELPSDSNTDKIAYKLYDQGTKLVIIIAKQRSADNLGRSKSSKRNHVEDGHRAELEYHRQRKSEHEAQIKARQEAQLQARKEAELKAKYAAEYQARQEALTKARQEAELKAKYAAEYQARQEAELKARQEAELKARQEAELKARQEAELKAKREAELRSQREAELQARKEAILKVKQEALLKAHQEAMLEARREAELEAEAELKRSKQDSKAKRLADLKAEAAERKERQRQENLADDVEEQRKRVEETLFNLFNGNPFGFAPASAVPLSRRSSNDNNSTSNATTASESSKSTDKKQERISESAKYGSQSMKNYTVSSRKPDFAPDYHYEEADDLAMSDAENSKKYESFDSYPSTPSNTAPNSPTLSSKVERSPTLEDIMDEEFV